VANEAHHIFPMHPLDLASKGAGFCNPQLTKGVKPEFDELRASVLKAFRKYLEDATQVICVMKKLRAQAGLT
jgi:hypothetical protein